MSLLEPWHMLTVAAVLGCLFAAKWLPESARARIAARVVDPAEHNGWRY